MTELSAAPFGRIKIGKNFPIHAKKVHYSVPGGIKMTIFSSIMCPKFCLSDFINLSTLFYPFSCDYSLTSFFGILE